MLASGRKRNIGPDLLEVIELLARHALSNGAQIDK